MKTKNQRLEARVSDMCKDKLIALAKRRFVSLATLIEQMTREEWEREMKKIGGGK